MKKLLVMALAVCLITAGCGYLDWNKSYGAEEETNEGITLKQGVLYSWDAKEIQQTTMVETLKTRKVEKWGKWNALWVGWKIDAGFAYNSANLIDTGAVAIGRQFGTLGDYLPLDFPLKDKITITLYPYAVIINDLFTNPHFESASGLSYIKGEIKF